MGQTESLQILGFDTEQKVSSHCNQPRRDINIYGLPLQKCREDVHDIYGSWDKNGKCSNRNADDPGVHQICFRFKHDTKNFSALTGQSNWSASREGKPHCVCVGAWSLYKTRQKNPGKSISSNNIRVTPVSYTHLTLPTK